MPFLEQLNVVVNHSVQNLPLTARLEVRPQTSIPK